MSRSARRHVSIGADFKPRIILRVACGQSSPIPSPSGGPDWEPDSTYGGGGTIVSTANAVITSKVSPAAPTLVYQKQRVGVWSYVIPGVKFNTSYVVRLHFNEFTYNTANARGFDLTLNGDEWVEGGMKGIDVYTRAGGQNIAFVYERTLRGLPNGTLTIAARSVIDQPILSGIEIINVTGNAAATIPPGQPRNFTATASGVCVRLDWDASLPGTNTPLTYDLTRTPALTHGQSVGNPIAPIQYIDMEVNESTQYVYVNTARDSTLLHSAPATSNQVTTRSYTGTIFAPSAKEIVLRMISSVVHGTTDWQTTYRLIADRSDGRGYTCGIGGFTTSLGELYRLSGIYFTSGGSDGTSWYTAYNSKLATIYFGTAYADRATTAHSLLDPNFVSDWQTRSDNFAAFRQAQLTTLERVVLHPALIPALDSDGIGELGQFIYADCLMQHTNENKDCLTFDAIRAQALAAAQPPSLGGNEKTYLHAFLDARRAALVSKGWSTDRIDTMQRQFLNDGNLHLTAPLNWTIGGVNFSIPTVP